MRKYFSLIIPTYNESRSIEEVCRRASAVLKSAGIDYEIIVVDDDSPDETWKVAEGYAWKDASVKVIRRLNEKGLATAVIAGWKQAQGDVLGVMDGDLQHPPEVLARLIRGIQADKNTDIVIASRYIKGAGVSRYNIFRRGISRFATRMSYFLLPGSAGKVTDPMSGYFVLRREIIERVSFNPCGYKILLELLVKAAYKKTAEVPYVFEERKVGASKTGLKQYACSFFHFYKLSVATGEIYTAVRKAIVWLALIIALVFLIRQTQR